MILLLLPLVAQAFIRDIIPETRRGRAAKASGMVPLQAAADATIDAGSGSLRGLRVGHSRDDKNTAMLRDLIESVMLRHQNTAPEPHLPLPLDEGGLELATPVRRKAATIYSEYKQRPLSLSPCLQFHASSALIDHDLPVDEDAYVRNYAYERTRPAAPRNVDSRLSADFGAAMAAAAAAVSGTSSRGGRPQLAEFTDPDPPYMNLLLQRQSADAGTADTEGFFDVPDSSDDEVRCIPKVMQVSLIPIPYKILPRTTESTHSSQISALTRATSRSWCDMGAELLLRTGHHHPCRVFACC